MADYITYKLTGADKLSATFKTLSQELQRQIVVPAAHIIHRCYDAICGCSEW